jgi:hypothetical protein
MAARQLSQELIFICLKFGITYQSIQIDKSNPNVLSELQKSAIDMVSKAIGNLEVNNHRHHIQLFLISPDHQPPSLKLITRSNDLTPTCFIEIIIWRSDQPVFTTPRDHILAEHTYKKPTYCSTCDYFMWGLIKQVCLFVVFVFLFYKLIRVNDVKFVNKIFIINVRNIYQLIVQVKMQDVVH